MRTSKGPQLIGIAVFAVVSLLGGCATQGSPPATPAPLPTIALSCTEARDSTQEAIAAYHSAHASWPTANGGPGPVDWNKLVPQYMDAVPQNDTSCGWSVDSDPEGLICVQHRC